MARPLRENGVGRGNGPGSARSQFKDGMPSANPRGRPAKPKEVLPGSVSEAITRALLKPVELQNRRGDKIGEMPQGMAMIDMLLNGYSKATVGEKLRILNWCHDNATDAFAERAFMPSENVVAEVLERLRQEYEEHGE